MLCELRMPVAEASPDGRHVRAVYEVFPSIPVEDAVLRLGLDEIGLTLRAEIPAGPLIMIAWGFERVEIPLPEPVGDRRIVNDASRYHPIAKSAIGDAQRKVAQELLERGGEWEQLHPGALRRAS